jgi:hypothetical protein
MKTRKAEKTKGYPKMKPSQPSAKGVRFWTDLELLEVYHDFKNADPERESWIPPFGKVTPETYSKFRSVVATELRRRGI